MLAMMGKIRKFYKGKPRGAMLTGMARTLYRPDARLRPLLRAFARYVRRLEQEDELTRTERTEAGELLEQIAFVAFDSIDCIEKIRSFPGALGQYDLYASGRDNLWLTLAERIGLQSNAPGLLIECKAREDKVDDPSFSRVCAILQQEMYGAAGMGVFFTISGATGFPEPGEAAQQKIGDARLRQALFHARTGKPVVVFTAAEILELDEPGALILALERKIEDIGLLPGTVTANVKVKKECQLPKHLIEASDPVRRRRRGASGR